MGGDVASEVGDILETSDGGFILGGSVLNVDDDDLLIVKGSSTG